MDADKARLIIPGERTKNGEPTLVPLSDTALALLDDLPRLKDKDGKALFAFTTTGDTPVSGFSKIKARLDATILALARKDAKDSGADEEQIHAISIEPWRFHDLRRTLASGCQRLGIRLEVSEAILNHVSGSRSGIAGVYHVYKFEDEKRAALAAWDRCVMALVAPAAEKSNVVTLERWA